MTAAALAKRAEVGRTSAWRFLKQREEAEAAKHGTFTGYQRHKRGGEDACARCLEAWREYQRDRRAEALASITPA